MIDRRNDLERIERALLVAGDILRRFQPGRVEAAHKSNSDPVTEADLAVDRALREELVRPGEAWLSEETADDPSRLEADRVWVVDPLDGTKEFVEGLPEWCVSIGLVENGRAVAGGILNPVADFLALGAEGLGCRLNGRTVGVSDTRELTRATVLASRSEVRRGEWVRWDESDVAIEAMGSVAYKLARVACGLADATWTLVPKHEWDVAAGVALVQAAGGWVLTLDNQQPRFNQPRPWLSGLIAAAPGLEGILRPESLLAHQNGGPEPDRKGSLLG
ncbi:MAG: 3'(2'),5'-bisphosphate nucleotidase CysQ [Acidimicrobiia bacterium]|nr:3'(2'),5'-bisphosphate nucleotidase CysQ [Acidimicrobiia bacterium]